VIAALFALLVLSLGGTTASAQMSDARRPLTRTERTRLEAGGLVVRPATERRGDLRLVGGVSYQVVDAPPDAVWRALNNVNEWRRMLPQVSESRAVQTAGPRHVVFIRQSSGPVDVSYYLQTTFNDDRKDALFMLDVSRRHDIRAAWGFMSVREWAGGTQALVSYGAMVDVGDGLLTSMVRGTVHEWMMKVPTTIKDYLEGSGRERYVRAERGRARSL
jgi:carbon monoxide dehydrogenase subunit G